MVSARTRDDEAMIFDLRLVAFVPWGAGIDPVVADTGPLPDAAALDIGGPRRLPARTWMEPCAGPAGVAGCLLDPDGGRRMVAVAPGPSLVTLPSPALAVAPRTGGLWSLTEEGLDAIRADGTVVTSTDQAGVRVLPAPDDAVWVLGTDRARRLTADGVVTADVAWPDPFNACVAGDRLRGWDPERPGGLVTVDPGGVVSREDAAGAERELFERPLALAPGRVAGAVLNKLVVRDSAGRASSLTVRGAGLDSAGRPFLATDDVLLHGGSTPIVLPEGGSVLAVDGDQVLTRTRSLDEDWYRTEAFPVAWTVQGAFPLIAAPDGEFMVAASGPTGLAVLGFRS